MWMSLMMKWYVSEDGDSTCCRSVIGKKKTIQNSTYSSYGELMIMEEVSCDSEYRISCRTVLHQGL